MVLCGLTRGFLLHSFPWFSELCSGRITRSSDLWSLCLLKRQCGGFPSVLSGDGRPDSRGTLGKIKEMLCSNTRTWLYISFLCLKKETCCTSSPPFSFHLPPLFPIWWNILGIWVWASDCHINWMILIRTQSYPTSQLQFSHNATPPYVPISWSSDGSCCHNMPGKQLLMHSHLSTHCCHCPK